MRKFCHFLTLSGRHFERFWRILLINELYLDFGKAEFNAQFHRSRCKIVACTRSTRKRYYIYFSSQPDWVLVLMRPQALGPHNWSHPQPPLEGLICNRRSEGERMTLEEEQDAGVAQKPERWGRHAFFRRLFVVCICHRVSVPFVFLFFWTWSVSTLFGSVGSPWGLFVF